MNQYKQIKPGVFTSYNALFHVSGIQYIARGNYTESVFLNADPHPQYPIYPLHETIHNT